MLAERTSGRSSIMDEFEARAMEMYAKDPGFRSLVLTQMRMLVDGPLVFKDLAYASALAGMLASNPELAKRLGVTT